MPLYSLRRIVLGALSVALLLSLTACNTQSTDFLGTAYVAPATVNLRRDLKQKNASGTMLTHGQRVGIVDVRRRFVKVRTAKGEEGWVDSAQLLSQEQMDRIHLDEQKALKLPSEGSATVFEALNIHIEPDRQSPPFAKIPEGGSVDVLAHRLVSKSTAPVRPTGLVFERPQPSARRAKKEKQGKNTLRISLPPPPKPPANWQELSAERIPGSDSPADLKAEEEEKAAAKRVADLKKPLVTESWTLVRTKNNQAGWVLSRNLIMSIPDEVAQYAEGKRITSYFDLGTINDDEKGPKHNWLWTTAARAQPFDFDSWRVFLWNRHRHRYETSYRQRDLEGYFPVHVDPADGSSLSRSFELITKDDDGKLRQRSYLFDGVRVHLTETQDYRPASAANGAEAGFDTSKLAKAPTQGWFARKWNGLKARLASLTRR